MCARCRYVPTLLTLKKWEKSRDLMNLIQFAIATGQNCHFARNFAEMRRCYFYNKFIGKVSTPLIGSTYINRDRLECFEVKKIFLTDED